MITSLVACVVLGLVAAAQSPIRTSPLDSLLGAFAKSESLSVQLAATLHAGSNADDHLDVRLSLKRSRFGRFEVVGGSGPLSLPTVVADGSRRWIYNTRKKTYISTPFEAGMKPFPPGLPRGLSIVLQAYLDAPAIVAGTCDAPWKASLESAKQSTADVDGEPCDVVAFNLAGEAITVSLAKETGLPRRVVEELMNGLIRITWDFKQVDLEAKLDDEFFRFRPPADAKDGTKGDATESPGAGSLSLGDVAPDITGTSAISGKELKLSDYRGKVVLLDFWFEKCGACRSEGSRVSDMNDELRSQGFVVLGVNPGIDSESAVEAYWKSTRYSFDTITTRPDDPITNRFGVGEFPTNFLIGRDGKILWRGVGFDEDALKSALRRAGLDLK